MHETQELERWLAGEVFGTPASAAPSTFLANLNPFERNDLLSALFRHRPDLALATWRLSLYDQLRLSVELVRGSHPPVPIAQSLTAVRRLGRCYAEPAGGRRRPRR